MMKILLLIGTGSFMGGILRYLISQWLNQSNNSSFPFGTLTVNVVGCFLIGIVIGYAEKWGMDTEWRLFLTAGFLGGFTTFSAFSAETILLMRNEQIATALIYVFVSVILGLLATLGGFALVKL